MVYHEDGYDQEIRTIKEPGTAVTLFPVPFIHAHPRNDSNTQRAAEIVNAVRYCPAVFIQASTALWLQKTAFFSARPHKELLP